jgi:phosphate transport system substrate-binding protein
MADLNILRCRQLKILHIIFVPLIFVFLSGCDNAGNGPGKSDQGPSRYLTIKGSDTMVHLVSTWAEEFMKMYPGTELSVTGGGSGTGIAALINKTTDICAASREIKQNEIGLAESNGVQPIEFSVARDAIVVVVHPDNPIDTLIMDQLGFIFTGEFESWSQVGGPKRPILVLSRESSSGTFQFFQEKILNKNDYAYRARLMPGTSAVIQAVSADEWSVGYVGLGYALEVGDEVKMIQVKADVDSPPITPSEETVKNGEYPISRPLLLYINGQAHGLVKDFIDFCLSNKGQQIVRETGYVQVAE